MTRFYLPKVPTGTWWPGESMAILDHCPSPLFHLFEGPCMSNMAARPLCLCLEMFALMITPMLGRVNLEKRPGQALKVGLRSFRLGVLWSWTLGEHIVWTPHTFSSFRKYSWRIAKGSFFEYTIPTFSNSSLYSLISMIKCTYNTSFIMDNFPRSLGYGTIQSVRQSNDTHPLTLEKDFSCFRYYFTELECVQWEISVIQINFLCLPKTPDAIVRHI